MAQQDDLIIDQAMLNILAEINQQIKAFAAADQGGKLQNIASLDATVRMLADKIDALNGLLSQEKEYRVAVTVDNADGAIRDLVSRVVEEILVRVKQENLLKVTNL